MFRPFILAIVRLYFNLSSDYTICVGYSGGVGGLKETRFRYYNSNTRYSSGMTLDYLYVNNH